MNAELRPFSLPLSDPLDTARGTIERRDGLLLRLEATETDSGSASEGVTVGVGEATPLPGWTEHYDECESVLADTAEAVDGGADPADLLADLDSTPAARHALDLALADLHASRDGVPLYRYLAECGRSASDRGATDPETTDPETPDRDAPPLVKSVPVNATAGDAPAEETVAEAERAAEAGFDCLKLKVGARPLSADVERVEAVSEALPEVELRADANAAWDRQQAQQFLDATGDRLAYVEQPLPATDLAGLAALSGPVALDETLAAVEFDDALDANPEAVVLKPMALGGPRRAVEVAERAREEGITPVVTTTIDGTVARTAAVHVAAAIPGVPACGLATRKLLESDLGPDIAPVADGRAVVPQGAGNGTADTWGYHD
ncbi:mandelate racemase/muconate lactonizing enzyme family protein [Halorussus sp. MSC15.2]|uniref:mandelate racemase/muconate lactonizing enzyme family protein n=1 Tax=Halorussus sp. MSC15.2 TaxID=2283638 RepID=UPI0013D6F27B|nr:o-succinylbenzoate synthase [Halorussus sp. MSC15.2]NEU56937.1 o-succinylbenzoate synthase [Halorussus sp. MSC15.2]